MKNIIIRTTSQTPIYQQLYEQISLQILNGQMEADSLLPSIRTAAKELRVSIITIKKTWEILEQNDLIYTVIGKGSYVKKSTQSALNKKKIETIKESIKESITLSHQMGLSKEDYLSLVSETYDSKMH